MIAQEMIDYHEDKIERLYKDRDKVQVIIHNLTKPGTHITITELLDLTKSLASIDKQIQSSIDIRSTLLNLNKK
jgi:uncharacterized protein YlaN (UPF0358 family)